MNLDPSIDEFSFAVWLIQEGAVMNENDAVCARLIRAAERELGAFMSVVTELHGPSQARIAAEDWIDALESPKEPFDFTAGEWRKITIVAAGRLAIRFI